jgi:hypothetical protein
VKTVAVGTCERGQGRTCELKEIAFRSFWRVYENIRLLLEIYIFILPLKDEASLFLAFAFAFAFNPPPGLGPISKIGTNSLLRGGGGILLRNFHVPLERGRKARVPC